MRVRGAQGYTLTHIPKQLTPLTPQAPENSNAGITGNENGGPMDVDTAQEIDPRSVAPSGYPTPARPLPKATGKSGRGRGTDHPMGQLAGIPEGEIAEAVVDMYSNSRGAPKARTREDIAIATGRGPLTVPTFAPGDIQPYASPFRPGVKPTVGTYVSGMNAKKVAVTAVAVTAAGIAGGPAGASAAYGALHQLGLTPDLPPMVRDALNMGGVGSTTSTIHSITHPAIDNGASNAAGGGPVFEDLRRRRR